VDIEEADENNATGSSAAADGKRAAARNRRMRRGLSFGTTAMQRTGASAAHVTLVTVVAVGLVILVFMSMNAKVSSQACSRASGESASRHRSGASSLHLQRQDDENAGVSMRLDGDDSWKTIGDGNWKERGDGDDKSRDANDGDIESAAEHAVSTARPPPFWRGLSVDFVFAVDARSARGWAAVLRWYVDLFVADVARRLSVLASFTVVVDAPTGTLVDVLVASFQELREVLESGAAPVPFRLVVNVDGERVVTQGGAINTATESEAGDASLCCAMSQLWALAWRDAESAGGVECGQRLVALVVASDVVQEDMLHVVMDEWPVVLSRFAADNNVMRAGWLAAAHTGVFPHGIVWLRQSYLRALTRPRAGLHTMPSWLARARVRCRDDPAALVAAVRTSAALQYADADEITSVDACSSVDKTEECVAPDDGSVAVGAHCAGVAAPSTGCFVGLCGAWSMCSPAASDRDRLSCARALVVYADREPQYVFHSL
jgi:hypothetical protein